MQTAQDIAHVAKILDLQNLSAQEAKFLQDVMRGIPAGKAAQSVGMAPEDASEMLARPHVAATRAYLMEQSALNHAPLQVDRDMITQMLFDSYHASANATEMRLSARELGLLHGLYAPEKHQHEHAMSGNSARKIEDMSNDDLARLAGEEDIDLDPADYQWSTDPDTTEKDVN